MTESLLERSARYVDDGDYEPKLLNPMDGSFHEIADGLAMVCGFSHIWTLDTGEGLVMVDASQPDFARVAVDHLRRRRAAPVDTIVYTHGHADHVTGTQNFIDYAAEQGHPAPTVAAHDAVLPRFDRYELTAAHNEAINHRQFGDLYIPGFFFRTWVRPDVTYSETLDLEVGETRLRLIHEKGETDDHTIVWAPHQGVLFSGDLIMWAFPNAGNPQKVQRYPAEWAAALRRMIELKPSVLAPAHGLPVAGVERIARLLDDMATALEGLVADTLAMMNADAPLDEILHTVRVPDHLMDRPYLKPAYDEPEFVVRNIWRLYGGWYDGNPARLKPPPDRALATEVAAIAGGAGALARRAAELAAAGDFRLACQLAEWAAQAAPADAEVHATRAEVYRLRRKREPSLMGRALYLEAAQSSEAVSQPEKAAPETA